MKKYDLSYQQKICALRNQSKPKNENINQSKPGNIGIGGKEPCKLP